MNKHLLVYCLCAALTLLIGCQRGDNQTPPRPQSTTVNATQKTRPSGIEHSLALWEHSGQQLQQLAQQCQQLKTTVDQLLQAPTAQTLQGAQQQWRQLHGRLRRLSLPLSLATHNPGLFTPLAQALSSIDTHPIAPGYVGAIKGYPHSGLINDISLSINHTAVRRQHGLTAPNEASLGLHPIEFVLFGEQGKRGAREFRQTRRSQTTLNPINQPHRRRGDYLRLSVTLLCDDLTTLAAQWRKPESSIAQPYFDLEPAARMQLWKLMLMLELDSLSQPKNLQHCDFAPGGCPVHWRLEGLLGFIDAGAIQALTLPEPQQKLWQTGVQQLRTALATPTDKTATSALALSQLADALSEQTRE